MRGPEQVRNGERKEELGLMRRGQPVSACIWREKGNLYPEEDGVSEGLGKAKHNRETCCITAACTSAF